MLAQSLDLAGSMKDDYVATDHLLVAIATVESPAQKVLTDAGLTADGLREAITAVRGNRRVTSESAEASYESLEKYSVDLTQAAEDGRLDPVIGRDAEIRRVVQVLSRRTKNNPVLIGEPGVGKTAVVEGLAQRVVAGDVPDSLKGRRVLSASTWPRWWPARSTAASSRSGSRPSSRRSRTPAGRSSPSSTSCTRSSARAPAATPRWTPATCSSRCSPAASCT